jgi:hypothetical protein
LHRTQSDRRCEPLPNRALNRTHKQLRCALLLVRRLAL